MASADTLAALLKQRQALEASNLPQVTPKAPIKVAGITAPRG
jgi:multidrug efflux system membrane fusion protein